MKNSIYYQALDNNNISEIPDSVNIDYGSVGNAQIQAVDEAKQEVPLDVSGLPIKIILENIGALPNEMYALVRRNGFGASDSSVLLGVNPYKNINELIKEKATMTISEEEKEIGTKVAVRKGNDLEPLIITKYEKYFGTKTIKPIDMYEFKEYPYLKINFDGVTHTSNKKPFPVEIKVATQWGEKHYNPAKAIFSEGVGFGPLPENVSTKNWSIETKAAYYGIPPYYYTQVQQEMMGCDAEYGHLCVLFDRSWLIHVFHIWKDERVQNDIILNGYKAWEQVKVLREANGWIDIEGNDIFDKAKEALKGNSEAPRKNLQESINEAVKIDDLE